MERIRIRRRWSTALGTRGVPALAALLAASVTVSLATTPRAADASTPSTSGTEFWVAFLENYSTPDALELFVASDVDTSGTVAGTPLTSAIDFSVSAGSVTTVSIPIAAEASGTGVQDIGLRVTTAAPVALYGINRYSGSSDAFTAIPISGLGTRYRIIAAPGPFFQSTFAVVATVDGTTISIDGGAAVSLDAGETYVAKDSSDLSGTLVTSSQPVSVLSGHMCSTFKGVNCDHLVEHIPPTTTYGTIFPVVRFANENTTAGRTKDAFKIVADTDGTAVEVDGVSAGTIDAGEALVVEPYGLDETSTLNGGLITTSEPALVAHYLSTGAYRVDESTAVNGDPSMSLVTPADQFRSSVLFATMADGFAFNAVNVVIPTSAVASVRLDGTAVDPADFKQLGTSDYSAAQITISEGSHSLTAATAFGATVYGANLDNSYALPGGVGSNAVTAATPAPDESNAEGGGPALACEGPYVVSSAITCTITGGDGGIDILWRLTDPDGVTLLEGPVTLDAGGRGLIDLVLPSRSTGQHRLELVAWGVSAEIPITAPLPASVPSGRPDDATGVLWGSWFVMPGIALLMIRRRRTVR